MEKIEETFCELYPFLEPEHIRQIVHAITRETETPSVSQLVQAFLELNRLAQQSSNLFVDCERKLEMCEDVLGRLLKKDLIGEAEAGTIEKLRSESKVEVAKNSGVVASCKLQQYYAALLRVQQEKGCAQHEATK